jgi:hypothetical protein
LYLNLLWPSPVRRTASGRRVFALRRFGTSRWRKSSRRTSHKTLLPEVCSSASSEVRVAQGLQYVLHRGWSADNKATAAEQGRAPLTRPEYVGQAPFTSLGRSGVGFLDRNGPTLLNLRGSTSSV